MKKDTLVVLCLIGLCAIAVGWRWASALPESGHRAPSMGYFVQLPSGVHYSNVEAKDAKQIIENTPGYDQMTRQQLEEAQLPILSIPRTVGLWFAAFFTLAIFSFLWRDNPLYKIAEHAFVGISAAYWMTVAFWDMIVGSLLAKLAPRVAKAYFLPGLDLNDQVSSLTSKNLLSGFVDYASADGDGVTAAWWQLTDFLYVVPLVLGVMLLWRLAPKGGWIARWPLAFIVGTTAGLRLIGHLESDLLVQVRTTIVSLYDIAATPNLTFYKSMNNILLVLSVICGIVYFFFSVEHKGVVGRVARLGIWVLMITFGASFGFTVMGRVALLANRFEFLVIDWLNLVDR
ncbi:MAG: hypothetical protein KDA32_08390 [Phycisphaerales bacterium]|nr:hypothetical protein [Phycisphaerales bacterium]